MHRRGTDPVRPRAPVRRARRRERAARELLGVEAVRRALRRILADRQRARKRLGRELVAESGDVFEGRLVGRDRKRRSVAPMARCACSSGFRHEIRREERHAVTAIPARPRAPRPSLAQHVGVADVIGEQQDQLCVDERALRFAEVAMQRDQRLVEIVGCGDIGSGLWSADIGCIILQSLRGRARDRDGARHRRRIGASARTTCWSGRKR